MSALLCLLCVSILGVTAAWGQAALPAELLPRISVRAGVASRLVTPDIGSFVRPFVSCELEWRMGPMSKAWWRNRDPQVSNEQPPRLPADGTEDEE